MLRSIELENEKIDHLGMLGTSFTRVREQLAITGNQFLSPMDLLANYLVTLSNGAITDDFGSHRIEADRKPTIHALHTEGQLKQAISDCSYKESKALPDVSFNELHKTAFRNINVALTNLARTKQEDAKKGYKIEYFSKDEIVKLYSEMEGTIHFFYLICLIGKHIHPDVNSFFKLFFKADGDIVQKTKKDVEDAIYTYLTYEKLLSRIIKEKIDIAAIYKNPTPEGLNKIVQLLELPKNATIQQSCMDEPEEVTLPLTKIFSAHPVGDLYYEEVENDTGEFSSPNEWARRLPLMTYHYKQWSFEKLLASLFLDKVSKVFLESFRERMEFIADTLNEKYLLLQKIIEKDFSKDVIKYDSLETEEPFPLILVCENRQKFGFCMGKLQFVSNESGYCKAMKPLILGEDIKIIATDSLQHQRELKEYLESKRIVGVEIISFEQLRLAQITGKRPHENNTKPTATVSALGTFSPRHRAEPLSVTPAVKSEGSLMTSSDQTAHLHQLRYRTT